MPSKTTAMGKQASSSSAGAEAAVSTAGDPDVARVAALFADPTRAQILAVLMAGRPLTATELVRATGVTKATVSAHLARLQAARFVTIRRKGRHHFVELADPDIGAAIEAIMHVATRIGWSHGGDSALRKARVCYDHLAGDLGVRLFDGLVKSGALHATGKDVWLTPVGQRLFARQGITMERLRGERRPLCRPCLDWSARRHHLAGSAGAALLELCLKEGWARRDRHSRVLHFSAVGERELRTTFGLR